MHVEMRYTCFAVRLRRERRLMKAHRVREACLEQVVIARQDGLEHARQSESFFFGERRQVGQVTLVVED